MSDSTTTSTRDGRATWLVVLRFDAPIDLNDENLLNAIASEVAYAGGVHEDSIIGNVAIAAAGVVELDAAYDAAVSVLTDGGE